MLLLLKNQYLYPPLPLLTCVITMETVQIKCELSWPQFVSSWICHVCKCHLFNLTFQVTPIVGLHYYFPDLKVLFFPSVRVIYAYKLSNQWHNYAILLSQALHLRCLNNHGQSSYHIAVRKTTLEDWVLIRLDIIGSLEFEIMKVSTALLSSRLFGLLWDRNRPVKLY